MDALAPVLVNAGPRIEALMTRVVVLDETYQNGAAQLYLGGLATVLPPALGGRPEVGKMHFDKAVALSGGRNLMAKVLYARNYARGVFDRELHDRLLGEVLAADPAVRTTNSESNAVDVFFLRGLPMLSQDISFNETFAVVDTRVSRSLSQWAETMRMALGRPSAAPQVVSW